MMQPFDKEFYDKLPISVCIFKAIFSESGKIKDFEVVYGNAAYREEWRSAYPNTAFTGKHFLRDGILDESSIEKIAACRTGDGKPFSIFLQATERHIHFTPFRIDDRYYGYFVTNITDYEETTNKEHFFKNIKALNNNAVLFRLEENNKHIPVWCSDGFVKIMDGTYDEVMELLQLGPIATIHPDDVQLVEEALDIKNFGVSGSAVTIRKKTLKNRYKWVNIHYSLVEDFHERYLYCTYFDVSLLKEHEAQLESMYEGIYNDFHRMGRDMLGIFRVNLTRDSIEEINGQDLYDSDFHASSYTEATRLRAENYPIVAEQKRFIATFDIQNLIRNYLDGRTMISEVLYSKRRSGRQCFVNYYATITRHPISGDIIAFIIEQEYNSEKVNETILQKILVQQFDMISYIVDGQYGVVIGDPKTMTRGNVFPEERNGLYMDYIRNQVISVAVGSDDEKRDLLDALSLDRIADELLEKQPYVVDITCNIDNETYYKRFEFYAVDSEARFYILLKSDFTELQKEQIKRNKQLKEALEEANQASVAKTSFLSRMSHEIRTPMNAIIGLDAIALQEPDLTGSMRDHLNKIGISAKYLLSLINDILDMSRIESGRMVLKNEKFSFRDFLDQINTLIYSQCQAKQLNFECNVKGRIDDFYIGDAMKLKQVLINILGNSVKFTESPGKVSFDVERVVQTEQQSTLRFKIRDTGIGIDAAYLPKLFEPFSQEDSSNTNSYGGSGLGLAISKNIIALMSGDISVTSKKNEGSEFIVDVMLKNSDDAAYKQQDTADVRPEEMSVLIIDDDPVACRHAQIVMEEVGISSEYCLTGQDAVELVSTRHARHEDYDLILVDLKMPVMDGVEVTRRIRSVIGEKTAIIILTAYSWSDIEEEALEAGVDSFIHKPLFSADIIREFRNVLNSRHSSDQSEVQKADLNGKRVLLAEDVSINAEIMKKLCGMYGMISEHAENGKIAVEMFENSAENYYDAVLMDVRMPVMDGLAATEAIRSLDRKDAKSIPIIAMTANAFDEDVQKSIQAGMDAHLSKPVEPEKLFESLSVLIAKKQQ
ncbi:MAG: response regulator [Firmicutes bacterium]|nr:response regulator [Bacillota bacterium]